MTSAQYERAADENLIGRARDGDSAAFAALWLRHSDAARRAAWQFRSTADPDDLVSESYARILEALQRGKGPHGPFRPYLYATMRNLVTELARANRSDPVDYLDELPDPASTSDRSIRALDQSLTVRAFRSLPERWQSVLWYTEVERMTPQQTAPLLGLTPNACSALAYRARDGLRTAWLQAHIHADGTSAECRWMLSRLGAYARGALPQRDLDRAQRHLAGCARCVIVAEEVDDVGSRLAIVLLPMLLGGTAAFGFIDSVTAPAVQATPGDGTHPASAGGAGVKGAVIGIATGAAVVAASAAVVLGVAFAGALPPVTSAAPDVPAATTPSPIPAPADPAALPPSPLEESPAPIAEAPAPGSPVVSPGVPSTEPVSPRFEPPVNPPIDPVEPVGPPGPADDASAGPPVIESILEDGLTTRPTLHGAAEPLATIEVRDQEGVLIATAIADDVGAWSTGVLDALETTTTSLAVTQTDADGNVSPPAELGPLAFVPALISPAPDLQVAPDEIFLIELAGWSATGFVLAFDYNGAHTEYVFGFDAAGTFSIPAQFGHGEATIGVRYLGADPTTNRTVTILVG